MTKNELLTAYPQTQFPECTEPVGLTQTLLDQLTAEDIEQISQFAATLRESGFIDFLRIQSNVEAIIARNNKGDVFFG